MSEQTLAPVRRQSGARPAGNVLTSWTNSWSGRIARIVLDGAGAYQFVSLAIDSGQLWQYAVAIFLLIDGIMTILKLIEKLILSIVLRSKQ